MDAVERMAKNHDRYLSALGQLMAPIPGTKGMGPQDRAQRLHAELERRIKIAVTAVMPKIADPIE